MKINRRLAINSASEILNRELGDSIVSSKKDLEGGRVSILLDNGCRLYVAYNSVGQYAYQIMKSPRESDFVRFDNFDNRWNVSTRLA